jgi:hypothetical protein
MHNAPSFHVLYTTSFTIFIQAESARNVHIHVEVQLAKMLLRHPHFYNLTKKCRSWLDVISDFDRGKMGSGKWISWEWMFNELCEDIKRQVSPSVMEDRHSSQG